MDFALTEQQQMFRDSVAAFARKELSDGALERAHTAHFPHSVAKKMAQAGLLGILANAVSNEAHLQVDKGLFLSRPLIG